MAYTNPNGSETMLSSWTQMQAEMQKNLWDGWFDTARMMSASNPYLNPYLEASEKWRELTEQSLQAWSGAENTAGRAVNGAASSTARSAAEGAMAGQNAMMQLMDMTMKAWGVLAPQLNSSNWPQVLENYTREVQEQFLDAATSGVQGTQNVMELWQTYLEEGQKFAQLWSDPFKMMPEGATQTKGSLIGFNNLFWDAFEGTVGRYASSPMLGYTREYNQKLLRSFDAWVDVQRANAEYSTHVALISSRAFNEILGEMVSLAQSGETITSFQALVQRWIGVADRVFVEEFRSPEYIRAQGKLLSAGMAYRQREEALQEAFLESRGLPTRTEVDETHKDIYELRKELRALKRQLRDVNEALTQPSAGPSGDNSTPLPDDMPERDFLLGAGVSTLEAVPRAEEDLVALNGIGPTRAKHILDYLSDSKDTSSSDDRRDDGNEADARARAL